VANSAVGKQANIMFSRVGIRLELFDFVRLEITVYGLSRKLAWSFENGTGSESYSNGLCDFSAD
jgi:hypothetical protein